MVTTPEEYFANLFKIVSNGNIPSLAVLLPQSENIYNIDLDSRTVEAPEFLSVEFDHASEVIYFILDRYYDNQDLSDTCCVIQYVNALNEGRLYVVPYYDIETYAKTNKMLVPWCIEGEATKAAGNVTFSIRFFKVDNTGKKLIYNFNSIPTKSKVLHGMNVLDYYPVDVTKDNFEPGIYYTKDPEGNYHRALSYNPNQQYYAISEGYSYESDTLEAIYDRLSAIEREFNVYWYEA